MRRLALGIAFTLATAFTSTAQQYQWGGAIGGTGYDHVSGSAYDAAGNMYVIGSFSGAVNFNRGGSTPAMLTSGGSTDVFVAKYTSTGAYSWAFRLGGGAGTASEGAKIVSDANGNVTVAGTFVGAADFDPGSATAIHTSAQYGEMFVARYDASGAFQWVITPGGWSSATAMATDLAGNIYVSGTMSTTCDFDPSSATANLDPMNGAVFIAKYTAAGAYAWAKNMAPTTGSISSRELALDLHGNIYLAGSFNGTLDFDPGSATVNLYPVGVQDTYFAKYDAQGNLKWAHNIGCVANATIPKAMTVDPLTGAMYLTGSHWTNIDLDPGAGTAIFTTHGNYNMYLSKYDSLGAYVWGHSYGGPSSSGPTDGSSLALDALGNLMVGGNYMQTVDFDPGPGVANLTATYYSDIFIAKYKSNGDYIWAKGLNSVHGDNVFNPGVVDAKIVTGPGGALYVSGTFADTVNFGLGASVAAQVSAGHYDGYFAKFKDTTGGLSQGVKNVEQATSQMIVYPTPAKDGSAVVKYDLVKAGVVDIAVYDMSGRMVQHIAKGEENAGEHTQALSAGLAVGNYMVQLRCGDAASVTRMIITE